VEEGEMRVRKESGQVENIKMGFAACVYGSARKGKELHK
jgi:hypothetical protein